MSLGSLARIALGVLALARCAAATPTTLVKVGTVSPLGWPFSGLADPTVDAAGNTVFTGGSTAAFARDAQGIRQRIGAGAILPDGRHVGGVGAPALASDGCVVVRAVFEEGGDGVVRACGSTFTILAEDGMAAPHGGTVRAFDVPVFLNAAGAIAYSATLDDGNGVVLRLDAGGTTEIARLGTPAPTGGTFTSTRVLGISGGGRVGFNASVSNGPNGIFVGDGSAIEAIALTGQASPQGGKFTDVGVGTVNSGERWTFLGALSTKVSGVFVAETSGPVPVLSTALVQGASLPIPNAVVHGFPSSIAPSIAPDGTIVLRALIEGTGVASGAAVVLIAPGGTLSVLARTRVAFPVGMLTQFRDPVIAADGSVVIQATVVGVGPALLVWRGGVLSSLAEVGDATDADTGDPRFRFTAASVTDTAEGAVFLGERDGIFRRRSDGGLETIAFVGQPTPLGGTFASLGSPVVDGRGRTYFGADVRGGRFNAALFGEGKSGLEEILAPDRRTPCGGSVAELFPTTVDSLQQPNPARRGVVFAAALQGTKAAQGLFAFAGPQGRCLVKTGAKAQGNRIASLGTPSAGGGSRIAFLAELGRGTTHTGVVAAHGGAMQVVATEGRATGTRKGGSFGVISPPAATPRGTVFQAVSADQSFQGVFFGARRRVGLLAASGDTATGGQHLRTLASPVGVGSDVWFLARMVGNTVSPGMFRVPAGSVPKSSDVLPVTPVLLPDDPGPADGGGVVVLVGAPQVGPSGVVAAVIQLGGGDTASAIVRIDVP
jgi:hypothetical protein